MLPTYTDNAPPVRGWVAWTTPAGITGHVLCWIIIIMYSSAVKAIRRRYFEIFWFCHHFFIPYYAINCIHGAFELLATPPKFWKYFIGPGLIYALERLARVYRGSRDVKIVRVIIHPNDVVEVLLDPSGFNYKMGQFVNCPYLSTVEWHPFTISSSPEDEYLGIHFICLGDWTRAFQRLLLPETRGEFDTQKRAAETLNTALIRIDGPYGAPAEEVFEYEVIVMIGAGIGVTPYASVLKTIRHRIVNPKADQERIILKKMYFYWVMRHVESLEWFYEILVQLEAEIPPEYFESHIFLTRADENDEAAAALTRLRAPPIFGRPNFQQIIQSMTVNHPFSQIGVFYCGPSGLGKNVKVNCRKFTSKAAEGCKFKFHKEVF